MTRAHLKPAREHLSPTNELVSEEVLDSIGSGLLVAQSNGAIVFANAAARTLLGDRVVGRSLHAVLPDLELSDDGRQRLLPLSTGGRAILLGYRCVSSALDGGARTVISFRDVTEMERMREEMAQMKRLYEIGRMCAVVAHEIRNPLAGIMATIQSIEREAEEAGLREPIELVQREVERLGRLLTSFFAFVRQRPPRRRSTDLARVVELARLSAGARLDGVGFETSFENLHPIMIDPDQMQQVLLNLILNAVEATGGAGQIIVRARLGDGHLLIRVEDDGCGIPAEQLDEVFEAFFTTKVAGTGLGLSICYRIIKAHGGTITLESKPGATSVLIDLPLAEPECQAACDARRS